MIGVLTKIGSLFARMTGLEATASGSQPGVYGPFYRTGSTQDNATIEKQLNSGEIWGKADRGSFEPSVDAYVGHLPPTKHGVEFYTDVEPS
jgi:hypothetical protein